MGIEEHNVTPRPDDELDTEETPPLVTWNPWNDIEQGRYDDDPNPYHGDYSED